MSLLLLFSGAPVMVVHQADNGVGSEHTPWVVLRVTELAAGEDTATLAALCSQFEYPVILEAGSLQAFHARGDEMTVVDHDLLDAFISVAEDPHVTDFLQYVLHAGQDQIVVVEDAPTLLAYLTGTEAGTAGEDVTVGGVSLFTVYETGTGLDRARRTVIVRHDGRTWVALPHDGRTHLILPSPGRTLGRLVAPDGDGSYTPTDGRTNDGS